MIEHGNEPERGAGLLEHLKRIAGTEMIDGADVVATAKMVDLEIAYKLLIVDTPVTQADDELYSIIPDVSKAKIRPDGQYEISWKTEAGPDFRILSADEAKVMRARFLLLKGFYGRYFNRLTLPKQNEVGVKYDMGFVPDILLEDRQALGEAETDV